MNTRKFRRTETSWVVSRHMYKFPTLIFITFKSPHSSEYMYSGSHCMYSDEWGTILMQHCSPTDWQQNNAIWILILYFYWKFGKLSCWEHNQTMYFPDVLTHAPCHLTQPRKSIFQIFLIPLLFKWITISHPLLTNAAREKVKGDYKQCLICIEDSQHCMLQ